MENEITRIRIMMQDQNDSYFFKRYTLLLTPFCMDSLTFRQYSAFASRLISAINTFCRFANTVKRIE